MTRKPAFIPYRHPATVVDLLNLGNMASALRGGLVFVHNKRDMCDRLVRTLCSNLDIRPIVIQTHTAEKANLFRQIAESEPVGEEPVVVIVETTRAGEDVSQLCEDIAKLKDRKCSVWLRGFVEDTDPKVLSLFHALFIFDCSDHEWQILRSVIDTTGKPETLRAEPLNKVLFFLNSELARDAPLLESNPMVLDLA